MKRGLSIIRGLPLALLFLLPLPLFLAIAPAALGEELKCLTLQQTSSSMGRLTIYLTKTAFRVNKGDAVTIARAPNWQIYWYNAKKKIWMTEPFKTALKAGALTEAASTAMLDVSHPWKKEGTEDVGGMPAIKLSNEPSAKATSHSLSHLRYWQYLDNDIPKQEIEWLATCYGVPNLGGIPLRCKYFGKASAMMPMARFTDDAAGDQVWLDTKDVHREVVSDSLFAVPKGYKETHNFTDLYLAQPFTRDHPMIKELLKDPSTLFQSQ